MRNYQHYKWGKEVEQLEKVKTTWSGERRMKNKREHAEQMLVHHSWADKVEEITKACANGRHVVNRRLLTHQASAPTAPELL